MIEAATGLVTRVRQLTESSLIIHWLTPEAGRIATVAKGARRQKSIFQGKLDLFYHCQISFVRSRRSELHTLREVKLLETYPFLRKDIQLLQQACYCAALIEISTEFETPVPNVYGLVLKLMAILSSRPAEAQTIFGFELKLLRELGFSPDLNSHSLNAGTKEIIKALTDAEWPSPARLILSTAQEREISHFLQTFIVFHLDKIPKGRSEALKSAIA
jgi:DNA repair protein RecO (recombination protein O)